MINQRTEKIIDLLSEEFPEVKEPEVGCITDKGKIIDKQAGCYFDDSCDYVLKIIDSKHFIKEYKIVNGKGIHAIGFYHLGLLLDFFSKKLSRRTFVFQGGKAFIPFGKTHFTFDISKHCMDRTEQQAKEVYEFMLKVK